MQIWYCPMISKLLHWYSGFSVISSSRSEGIVSSISWMQILFKSSQGHIRPDIFYINEKGSTIIQWWRTQYSKCRRRSQSILLAGSHLHHSTRPPTTRLRRSDEIKFAWLKLLTGFSIINVSKFSSFAANLWLHSSDFKLRPILVAAWKLVKTPVLPCLLLKKCKCVIF